MYIEPSLHLTTIQYTVSNSLFAFLIISNKGAIINNC